MPPPPKTSAEAFAQYVPGTLLAVGNGPAWTDLLIEVYARRRTETCLVVPAVAEPLVVLIRSESAFVEEREFGGTWTGRTVTAGEFFLTTTPTPYESRWQVTGPENLETLHAYLGLPLFARAFREARGVEAAGTPQLREVFGERDAVHAPVVMPSGARSRTTSRRGGAPNRRVYSRLNCEGLP